MESDSDTHAFRPNTHLHTAIALYNIDRKLRSLVFTSIQDIEVALRTRIIHYFSLAHGPFWWLLVVTVNCYTDIGFGASAQSRFIGFGNTY